MNHERHLGIYQVPIHFHVGLVGAGGIGAMTALVLSKMGVVQLSIWDQETVSETNIPTQLHVVSDVGNPKVIGLQRTLEQFSDEVIVNPFIERIDENTHLPHHYDLFITAVDSITARQQIWKALQEADVEWLIDARMAAEKSDMFVLDMQDPDARNRYEAMLMSLNESDVPDLVCTEKATFHCASAAAANIGAAMRNILRGEQSSARVIHFIPQFQTMTFNL